MEFDIQSPGLQQEGSSFFCISIVNQVLEEKAFLIIDGYKTFYRGPVALVCKIKAPNNYPLFTQIETTLGFLSLGLLTDKHTAQLNYAKIRKELLSKNLRFLPINCHFLSIYFIY